MNTNDWIKAVTEAGPFIVAVVAIVMWSLESIFGRKTEEDRKQTELLERIAAQVEKSHS